MVVLVEQQQMAQILIADDNSQNLHLLESILKGTVMESPAPRTAPRPLKFHGNSDPI